MPLDEFVAEAVALLDAQPDAKEIQVERVKFVRYGEARGDYDQVVQTPQCVRPARDLAAAVPPQYLFATNRVWAGNFVRISVP
jgi:hypothetical protein